MAGLRATECCARANLLELCTPLCCETRPRVQSFPGSPKGRGRQWRRLRAVGPIRSRAAAWVRALEHAFLANETSGPFRLFSATLMLARDGSSSSQRRAKQLRLLRTWTGAPRELNTRYNLGCHRSADACSSISSW